jgi:hypothetical protein
MRAGVLAAVAAAMPAGVLAAVVAAMLAAVVLGCAGPRGGSAPDPAWPYARISSENVLPPGLAGRSLFWGRWIVADPDRGTVLSESTDPRYLLRLSFDEPRRYRILDLGPDAVVETLAFLDRGRSVLLVGSVGEAQTGTSVYARALLRFDLEQDLLVDAIPLRRGDTARGLAIDPQERRAFLLVDDGFGNGSLEVVDLYTGKSLLRREVGGIPAGVGRRGLVTDRNARSLFCLSGGQSTRSDFAPVDEQPELPEILVLDADSLTVEARIPIDEKGVPIALAYDAERDRVVVLEAGIDRSRVILVDAAYREVRDRVGVDQAATDLVIQGSYAFLPGPRGIAVVDLDRALVAGYALFPLERTGEMAVSGDRRRALVFFQGGAPPGSPGIALVGLDTGTLLDVLQ